MSMNPQSPSPHARLFLSQEEWDNLSDKLADPFFVEIASHCRDFVMEFPAKAGDDLTDIGRSLDTPGEKNNLKARTLKNILQRCAVAWHLDRDDAALRLAGKAVDLLCNTVPWAPYRRVDAGAADLHTADLTYCAAFALDVLGRDLTRRQRDMLIYTLRDRGLALYLEGLRQRNWWRHAEFNWGTALHGQAGLGALALEPYDPELSEKVLREAIAGIQYPINDFQPGGGWIEGMMYQATTMGHLIDFALPLYRVKNNDLGLLENRNFHDAFESRTQMIGGDGEPYNFSDCPYGSEEIYLPHAYWFAKHLNRPDWAAFEDRVVKSWRSLKGLFHDTETFWYRETNQETGRWGVRRYYCCDGLDWHFWRGEESWLAFRGGQGGGNRGNWDLGHFILGHGRERFLFDPSHEGRATSCHNAVTIRGFPQSDFARCPVITRRHWEDGCYLCCDMREAFPNILSHYFRHLLLIGDRHLLVLDDIMACRGRRNSAAWHLTTRMDHERRGNDLFLLGTESSARLRFLSEIRGFDVNHWNYRNKPIHTFQWNDGHDRVRSVMPLLISFDGEEPEIETAQDLFTLRLCSHRWHLDLAEGTLSLDDSLV